MMRPAAALDQLLIGKWRLSLTRSRRSLPGLKCGTYLPGHGFARLRVASDAGRPVMQRETAETTNLDTLPLCERVAHQVQQVLDSELDILGREMLLLAGNGFDQF